MDSCPVSWYGVTFFRGNDGVGDVSLTFILMTGVVVAWESVQGRGMEGVFLGVVRPFDRLSSNCGSPLSVSLPRWADRGRHLTIAPLSIDEKATQSLSF